MDGFTTEDLAKRTADVLAAADDVAVEVTHDDAHRYVVMSREQYDRMRERTRKVLRIEDMADDLFDRMVMQLEAYCADADRPE